MAKSVIDQLKAHGHTKRGWLGVRIQMVTPDIAESLGLGTPRGALVSSMSADGPAAKAGLQQGDIILSFDGKPVTEMRRLPRLVAETEVGRTVPMTVFRKGKEITLDAKVGELQASDEDEAEEAEKPAEKTPATPSSVTISELGISVAPLNANLRKRFDIGADANGVVVLSTQPDSQAAEKGIQVGDLISEAAQQDIKEPKELANLAAQAKRDKRPLLLLVDRKGELRFVAINFGKNE